jgi:hypothetical protein
MSNEKQFLFSQDNDTYLSMLIYRNVIITIADVVEVHVINLIPNRTFFSASQSGKYSVTLHFRSRELRFPEQC